MTDTTASPATAGDAAVPKKALTWSDFMTAARRSFPIDVPELGGVVYVRKLSAREVIAFSEITDEKTQSAEQFRLLARALVNEDGSPLLPEGKDDEIGELPLALFSNLFARVAEYMGIQTEKKDAVDGGTEGNVSGGDRSDGSPTDSRKNSESST